MKNTIMNTVTIKEFLKSMKIAHKAGNAQILFGLPGIGKTELILSEGLKILSTESFKFTDEYKDYLLSAPYSAEKIESIVDGMRKPKFSRSEIIQEIKLMTEEFSSPFIEERLYLENFKNVFVVSFSALLSWSNIDQNNGLD